jgi:hypothetical protein
VYDRPVTSKLGVREARLALIAVLAVACGGKSEGSQADGGSLVHTAPKPSDAAPPSPPVTCRGRTPPPPSTALLTLRLDTLNLGDLDTSGAKSPSAWRSVGYDLDGLCTTNVPTTFGCRRVAPAPASVLLDGNDGIDNGFGHTILPLLEPFAPSPSKSAGGKSYLQLAADGGGALHLGIQGAVLVVPLVDIRASLDGQGRGALGAIVPREPFAESIRQFGGRMSAELCEGNTIESIVQSIRQAADILSGIGPDASVECNGISFGMTFAGTPVSAIPQVPPSPCDPKDGGTDSD